MDILFRVDANQKIGWGHFIRSFSLAKMLGVQFSPIFLMDQPPEEIVGMLDESGFGLIDLGGSERSEKEIFQKHTGAGIIVFDGYHFSTEIQEQALESGLKVVVIDDHAKSEYSAHLVINHAPLANDHEISSKIPGAKYAIGPDYALLRPVFLENMPEVDFNENRQEIKTLFVCFGGADPYKLAVKATLSLLKSTNSIVNLVASDSVKKELEKEGLAADQRDRLKIFSNQNETEMKQLMTDSDFGIVPASGLLYECIACRLPVLAGFYVDNQKRMYEGFKALGVFVPADSFLAFNFDAFNERVQEFDLFAILRNQVKVIDGQSPERIRELFSNLSEQ